jgi:hypothetical protein
MSQVARMLTDDEPRPRRFRLWLLLWLAGMPGPVVVTATVLPQLLSGVSLPAPKAGAFGSRPM